MGKIKTLLGKRIQELRNSKNIKQDILAEKIGIGSKSLSYIENGKNYPTPDNLEKIADALDVTPKDLFDFSHHQEIEDLEQEIIRIFNSQTEENQRLLYKVVKSFDK